MLLLAVTVGISALASGLADKLVPSISLCGPDLKCGNPHAAVQPQILHNDLRSFYCFQPQTTSGIFSISSPSLLLAPANDRQQMASWLATERLHYDFIQQHGLEAVLALEAFWNFPPVA